MVKCSLGSEHLFFWWGGGGAFCNSLKLDFFQGKGKAFIFVAIKSIFKIAIRPQTYF